MHWVGTWACAPQLTELENLPPPPGLRGNVLRQIVRPSLGGRQLRVRLSNLFGDRPVTMTSVRIARALGAFTVDRAGEKALAFSGSPKVTLLPGASSWSDPLDHDVAPLTDRAVTIAFGDVPAAVTGHPGSRTTSYLQEGGSFEESREVAATDHWYFLTGIDVLADSSSGAVVTLGDSLTDGRGSTTNGNDRWPDNLARRLRANRATTGIAVLNQGMGGNAVLAGGLGPTALQRFERDVIAQSGVRWLIVLEGANDIGASDNPTVATRLIAAYQTFIGMARDHGIRAYGVPILPFGGSQYASAGREAVRQAVNRWIRSSGGFDAVIDLDAAVRDPGDPTRLLRAYDTGDHLHLNVAGYRAMADAVDLSLFAR